MKLSQKSRKRRKITKTNSINEPVQSMMKNKSEVFSGIGMNESGSYIQYKTHQTKLGLEKRKMFLEVMLHPLL